MIFYDVTIEIRINTVKWQLLYTTEECLSKVATDSPPCPVLDQLATQDITR